MGQNAGDIFRSLKVGSLENLKRFLTIHGLENCEAARAKGKGVITLTLHLGAFDLQATALALLGFSPYIIGTALKDERLNALLKNYRNAYGAIAIERGKETVRLFKALKNGGSLAILIDQDTDVQSVFVNFFNRPASTPLGAAMLALRSGAAVVPMYIYLDDNLRQQMHFLPEIELARTGNDREDIVVNTQIFTSLAEELIRKYPEQWVWMHERWRTQPSAEKN
ncbi:MAG: lipid A biosynthesis lauroyl acyltransferase [Candidatus Nephrothrix sp. EaCA]|nr:MAG: lipid A biosynthesis lauroyl acyltransferase [Candidatus Nephrothrix sp. EaCA]